MDKSGSGHNARLPLIIERPDLTHPFRRWFAVFLTLFAWLYWVKLWLPALAIIGQYFGVATKQVPPPSGITLLALQQLLAFLPWAISLAFLVIVGKLLKEKLIHSYQKKRTDKTGNEQLAMGNALDPQSLRQWQASQILYVEHGAYGRVINAHQTLEQSAQ